LNIGHSVNCNDERPTVQAPRRATAGNLSSVPEEVQQSLQTGLFPPKRGKRREAGRHPRTCASPPKWPFAQPTLGLRFTHLRDVRNAHWDGRYFFVVKA
jgi:hypothetical protein